MDKFKGYEAGGDVITLWPERLRTPQFFDSDRAYRAYQEAEKTVMRDRPKLEFDWLYLLQILFGRVK